MDIPIINNLKVENIKWRKLLGKSSAYITVEILGGNAESLVPPVYRLYSGGATEGNYDDIVKILEENKQWVDLPSNTGLFGLFDEDKFLDLVSERVKEAIADTASMNGKPNHNLEQPEEQQTIKPKKPILKDLLAKCDPDAPFSDEEREWESMKPVGNEFGAKELDVVLDKYHYHEALDRTHIVLCDLENALGKHPAIQDRPESRKLYDEAVSKLGELYQKIAEINLHN